jgi:two-component system, NtrC family, sensor histidine kinase KinB
MSRGDRRASERTRTSLDLLYRISRELAAHLDLPELLQRVLQLTLENVGAASGSILVLDEHNEVSDGAYAYGGKVHDHTARQMADTFERGLAGWVVDNRQAALVESTREDPRWLRRPGDENDGESRSAISVPLLAHDRIVGVLTLVHPQERHFGKDDLALLTAIADQAGIAVENARLFTAEQERRRFASTLQEIARTISATLEPSLVFPQVLEQLERVVDFDSASIFVVDHDRLRLVAARGFSKSEDLIGQALPVDPQLLTGQVLTRRQPIVVADVQGHTGWKRSDDLPESTKIHGWIGAPLIVREQAVGVLNVDSHRIGAYAASQVEVVMAFAHHAATAVANAQLFAESQRQVQAMVALAETARVVTASLNLDEVLNRILAQTLLSMQVEAASLSLVNERDGSLEFIAASGDRARALIGMRLRKGEGVAGWVAENHQAIVIPDAQNDPRFFPEIDVRIGFTTLALAAAPIQVQDRTIGVLEAINPQHGEFISDQKDLLLGIAGLAGTAISHAQLFAETQAARRRYAGLFEDSIDPILLTDLSGIISDANLNATTFLGRERGELLGTSMIDVHQIHDRVWTQALSALEPGETLAYDSLATHKDGQRRPIEVHVKRIDIERQPILQWILRDISERLALEELRSDLTSMIFHDLRSPLGNVISSLEVLSSSVDTQDQTVAPILAIALRSSHRLSRLIDSLLDLGQLEAGKAVLQKNKAAIGDLARDALQEVLPLAEAKGHHLNYDQAINDLPTVEMDTDMIRRVVINLLENAVKYTRTGGTISIGGWTDDGQIVISIADNGPGIDDRDQDTIFNKFARIHHEGRPKGLGLGLAFCRMAVEAHGGSIWVESRLGEGSTFSFSLPL